MKTYKQLFRNDSLQREITGFVLSLTRSLQVVKNHMRSDEQTLSVNVRPL